MEFEVSTRTRLLNHPAAPNGWVKTPIKRTLGKNNKRGPPPPKVPRNQNFELAALTARDFTITHNTKKKTKTQPTKQKNKKKKKKREVPRGKILTSVNETPSLPITQGQPLGPRGPQGGCKRTKNHHKKRHQKNDPKENEKKGSRRTKAS